jgi:hypothetical protein
MAFNIRCGDIFASWIPMPYGMALSIMGAEDPHCPKPEDRVVRIFILRKLYCRWKGIPKQEREKSSKLLLGPQQTQSPSFFSFFLSFFVCHQKFGVLLSSRGRRKNSERTHPQKLFLMSKILIKLFFDVVSLYLIDLYHFLFKIL